MPFPIVVMNQRANGSLYNAQDPNVPILEATPLEFGDWQTNRGFIKIEMMGTVFQSVTSTFKCMANFGLTQWILGASSAVFPGALPAIDAAQPAINQWLKEARKSIWMNIGLGVVSALSPSFEKVLGSSNPDVSGAYQDLGAQGLLTANVFILLERKMG